MGPGGLHRLRSGRCQAQGVSQLFCCCGAHPPRSTPLKTFITQRWHGRIGWRTLFWRDLLLIGTGLNLLMTGVALALLSQDVPIHWVLLAHLLPLPYNLLIVSALWHALRRPAVVLGVSVFWLILFIAV